MCQALFLVMGMQQWTNAMIPVLMELRLHLSEQIINQINRSVTILAVNATKRIKQDNGLQNALGPGKIPNKYWLRMAFWLLQWLSAAFKENVVWGKCYLGLHRCDHFLKGVKISEWPIHGCPTNPVSAIHQQAKIQAFSGSETVGATCSVQFFLVWGSSKLCHFSHVSLPTTPL